MNRLFTSVAAERRCLPAIVVLTCCAAMTTVSACTESSDPGGGAPVGLDSSDQSAGAGGDVTMGDEVDSDVAEESGGSAGVGSTPEAQSQDEGTGGDSTADSSISDVGGEPGDSGGVGEASETPANDASIPETAVDASEVEPVTMDADAGSGIDEQVEALPHVFVVPEGAEVFSVPEECGMMGACPAALRCFQLTQDFGVCDRAEPPTSGACTGNDDACGCDDLTCESGEVCIAVEETCSCAPSLRNVCVESVCQTESDCTDGTVCTPSSYLLPGTGRCLEPRCSRDADCVDGQNGRCSLLLVPPLQSGEIRIADIRCVYEDTEPNEDACQSTQRRGLIGTGSENPYYCPELNH